METNDKIQYLIVDTSAFIKNAPLQDLGVNIITDQDVVNEITNKRQLRRLVALPYDLKIQSAFAEDIKHVSEFCKKTGDYPSLSATDIKVIALTYRLEKTYVGTEHLKEAPTTPCSTIASPTPLEDNSKPLVGFYIPQTNEDEQTQEEEKDIDSNNSDEQAIVKKIYAALEDDETVNKQEKQIKEDIQSGNESSDESEYEEAQSDILLPQSEGLADKFAKLTCEPVELKVEGGNGVVHDVDDILALVKKTNINSASESDENEDYEDDDDSGAEDDDDDWITPKNIKDMKKKMELNTVEEKPATVACLTMDFAMQNVLMQMGLHVASLDGKVIKQMRTFIFRCYACFKTTSIMTKVFCPYCGNKTLKKVAVSIDENGKQQIHINSRRPLTARGKRFSLPTPKGGKHANNPILYEDQPQPDQRPTRLARTKNNPLEDDYIAGYSPFIMRDVNSKSAMLGIRPGGDVKYWMKRNPNESRKKRK